MHALRTLALVTLALAPLLAARAESPEVAAPSVERAVFTTEIRDREPVGEIAVLPPGETRVYFFTELLNLEGKTVFHRWQYRGETLAEVSFEVRGPRWRVYSSKNLLPGWAGDWNVSVVTDDGQVLTQDGFAYVAPDAAPEAAGLPASPDRSE